MPSAYLLAGAIVAVAQAYLVVGGLVAIAFLALGLARVDPLARCSYAFRPLLVPGLVLIWPLVLVRWRSLAQGRG